MWKDLSRFQVLLLLYFYKAEPEKRTVTSAAKYYNRTKVFITRTLDSLEKLGLAERTQTRKTILSPYGETLAQKLWQQFEIAERYMQYLDMDPLQARNNALSALLAGFSEEYWSRMREQEARMRIKATFAGRQNFNGQELCSYLKDGSYFFPVVIYRVHTKNGDPVSAGNRGFTHPCELIVKNHTGTVYLTMKNISLSVPHTGRIAEKRVKRLSYQLGEEMIDAEQIGRYIAFPAKALRFISMGNSRDMILHGSVPVYMEYSGELLTDRETSAVFTMLVL